jgi:catechol 2,3-dioxygenase-like lactoylglutathione lyase family enzyme
MSSVATQNITRITGIIPQFLVDDLDRALTYYCNQLGFVLDFQYEDFYASVMRDGFAIHLKCGPKSAADREFRKQNEHLDAYVAVSGVRGLFSDLESRGASILKPLEERPWGCVDCYVQDPDGNILCFSERISAE